MGRRCRNCPASPVASGNPAAALVTLPGDPVLGETGFQVHRLGPDAVMAEYPDAAPGVWVTEGSRTAGRRVLAVRYEDAPAVRPVRPSRWSTGRSRGPSRGRCRG